MQKDSPMVHFNIPPLVGTELDYIAHAVNDNRKISGDGPFTKLCNEWLETRFDAQKVLLTTSGTSALEMAAILCNIEQGDEVILPSFTFTSTATAFVLAGARLVFVDIRSDTMNIDENKIEEAITDKTKAICVVHYAGVACEMDSILDIAHRHDLYVVEDAAQGVMSTYKGTALGTMGDFGCYSFHETKNYSMGEGGAIVINRPGSNDRAEIIREKGTNRAQFFRGQVAKYNWMDFGSSYLPSEINAAYLWAQLQVAEVINSNRIRTWNRYRAELEPLEREGFIELPFIPNECTHNAHMFYIKVEGLRTRSRLIEFMKKRGVLCVFHYVPLHTSPAGKRFGRFHGEDEHTTIESDRLLRLPMYYNIADSDLERVIEGIRTFFTSECEGSVSHG